MPQLINRSPGRIGYCTTALRANCMLSSLSFQLHLSILTWICRSFGQSFPASQDLRRGFRDFYSISSGTGSLCIALAHLPCSLLHAMAPDARESLLVPPIVQNNPVNASPEHDSLIPPRTSATNRTQSSFAITVESHNTPTHSWSPPPVRTLPGM